MDGEDRFTAATAAYAVLKKSIEECYPHGQFVAIAGGELVADAESIEGLTVALSAIGLSFEDVVAAQAGIEPVNKYLGYLLTSILSAHWIKCVLPAGK